MMEVTASIDWSRPLEIVPDEINTEPLHCELIIGMSDSTHAFVRIGKERVPATVEGEEDDRDLWFIPGREGDSGKRVGSRLWWYLKCEGGRGEAGLPDLRNVAVSDETSQSPTG